MLFVFVDYTCYDPAMLFACLVQLEDHLKIPYHVYVICNHPLGKIEECNIDLIKILTNCKIINSTIQQQIIDIVDSRNDYKMFIDYGTMLTKDITELYPCYIYTNKLEYICRRNEEPVGYLFDTENDQSYTDFLRSPKHNMYTHYKVK